MSLSSICLFLLRFTHLLFVHLSDRVSLFRDKGLTVAQIAAGMAPPPVTLRTLIMLTPDWPSEEEDIRDVQAVSVPPATKNPFLANLL